MAGMAIQYIYGEETKFIEFKRDYTQSLLKTVSAFANYHDGRIMIGIDDKGQVIGVSNISQLRLTIEDAINNAIHPRPYFEMFVKAVADKKILEIKVLKGDFVPYYYRNKAYKRSDTSTIEIDRAELNQLILTGQNFSFEDLKSAEQSLNFYYLEKKFRDKKKINSISEDVLKSLELIKNDHYVNAANLLSDQNNIDNAAIVLVKYQKEFLNIQDRVLLKNMSLVEQFDKCLDFFQKHVSVKEIIRKAYRETIEEIPIIAFREAMANAILHRDYMLKSEIKVEFYDDRVEIISPGGLPHGISEEEYADGRISVMRNRIVADIFLRLGIIEKLATGIRRIKENYSPSRTQPRFDVKKNSIKVVLPVFEATESNEKHTNNDDLFSGDERKILNHIRRYGEVSRKDAEVVLNKGKTQSYKIIKGLIGKGQIGVSGSGKNTKYYIL